MTTTFPINDQMYMEVDDSGAYRALHIEGQRLPFATAGTSTVAASRDLTKEDTDQTLICTSASAIVLTILNDATVAWSGVNAVAAYQGGSGAVSFANTRRKASCALAQMSGHTCNESADSSKIDW
jgi:hypothetical protein